MVEVTLENLPKGATQATVQAWYFEEGDAITKGDEIAELALEESTVMVTAPETGILAEVYYDEGELVETGEVLCLIETEDSSDDDDDDEEEEDKEEEKEEKEE